VKVISPKRYKASAERLGNVLRETIRASGLTQQQIARDTGIKQPALCRFLRGASIKVETVSLLFDYFGFQVVPPRSK
jgi:transcriptional regulator with XRE-family HTH domain